MIDLATYGGLFAIAFLAASIFPAQSEAALAGLLMGEAYPPAALITVASVGNVLGSVVNWMLGRGVGRLRNRIWFPANQAMFSRAEQWYQRYGRWSLLLSWAPVVGDPLTVVAGVLKEPFWSFLAIVALAKTTRYVLLAGAVLLT